MNSKLPNRCYIGLGSNLANELGTPTDHIANAIQAFKISPHFFGVQVSSLYRSKAFGVTDQPDFINAVLSADTDLLPLELLDFCQRLEQDAKRERLRHWGERSLDVDILLYGDRTIEHARLKVPHSGLFERNFVLIPLVELNRDLTVNQQKLAALPLANHWDGLAILSNDSINTTLSY